MSKIIDRHFLHLADKSSPTFLHLAKNFTLCFKHTLHIFLILVAVIIVTHQVTKHKPSLSSAVLFVALTSLLLLHG